MGYKILVADDEAEIRQLLRIYLEKDGYEVIEADNGLTALEICKKGDISMALLDIMMPKMNGYQVVQKIRDESNIPIIMISAKTQDEDKILGLDLGADDYIAKPFNPLEALARINSNIRRFYRLGAGSTDTETIKVGDLLLNISECMLYKADESITLTSVEFRIMKMFMENPGRVFTKQQIYETGWEDDFYISDNNILVCMSKLRSKLGGSENEYIKTIRGLGYRLNVPTK